MAQRMTTKTASCLALAVMATVCMVAPTDLGHADRESVEHVAREAGRPRLVVQVGHSGTVNSAAFSPDGLQVVTASADNSARLWDVATGKELRKFEGHQGWVEWIDFAPNGRQIATADGREARLWDVTTGDELRTFSGHNATVTWLDFSPDGRRLATASLDSTVRLWDLATGRELRTFVGPLFHGFYSVAFSPDGSRIVAGGTDTMVRLWDVDSGAEIQRFEGHTDIVYCVAFSPGGKHVVSGSKDKIARVWDVTNGRELQQLDGHSSWILSVTFSADGQQVLTASWDQSARIWDVGSGKAIRTFEGNAGPLWTAAFSPDGDKLVSGGADQTARIWETESGQELRTLAGSSDRVAAVDCSPDGRHFVIGSGNSAYLWDVGLGREIRAFEGHAGSITAAAFSDDGQRLVTGSADQTARLWDVTTGKELRKLEGHQRPILDAAFSRSGRLLVTAGEDNARLWDLSTGAQIHRFAHRAPVAVATFSPDGSQCVTGSWDHARLWDADTGRQIRSIGEDLGGVGSAAFSPDGQHLLTATADAELGTPSWTASLWDVASGQLVHRFEGHSGWIESLAFSPDGKQVITAAHDSTVRVWDPATGNEIGKYDGFFHSVAFASGARQLVAVGPRRVHLLDATTGRPGLSFEGHVAAISPDATSVVSASSDGTARLWSAIDGNQLRKFDGHTGPITCLAFSTDGRQVVSGSMDRTARLWDAETGREIQKMVAHTAAINSVAFSPDGRRLVTGSQDGTARLWDAASGREIRQISGHLAPVTSVAFSADETQVVTASWDTTVRAWDVGTGKVITTFSGHTDRVHCVAISPDGQQLVSGSKDRTLRLWDLGSGDALHRFARLAESSGPDATAHGDAVWSVAFSPNGRQVVSTSVDTNPSRHAALSSDHTARLWDADTGRQLQTLEGHLAPVSSVAFAPDGRFLLTGSLDHTARLWNAATGQELCKLVSFRDGWAVVDAEGRYDASNGGIAEGMHWVIGNEPIALEQLKERYYEPGLLAKITGLNKEPLREVNSFSDPKLYPHVQLSAPTEQDPQLKIDLRRREGGFGRVVVKINGKELTADARGLQENTRLEARGDRLVVTVDLAGDPRLKPGEQNEIEVFAFNQEDYLSSRGLTAIYTPPGRREVREPVVWAVVAGVSNYRGEAIDLRYAAKDADDFAQALRVAAARLFGAEQLKLTLLSTTQADPSSWPNKVNIMQALSNARKAHPGDILVVYLAGHGVTHGGQDGDFYYLTSDANSARLRDEVVRERVSLSSQELTESIKQIPALKQVFILDTCASGQLIQKLTEERQVASSQIRALQRVKDRTGMYVLAGCAADAVSYEASHYGQGLLTHSLLLGMRGAALREEQFVDVSRLFDFAADRVPQLAQGLGGVQRPVIASPKGGASFDIGQVLRGDRQSIRVQSPRPLVLRANFQDELDFEDTLELAKRVNEGFREISTRGSQAPLFFVDASQLPSAYRVAGRYLVAGDSVAVTVQLSKDDQRKRFIIEGRKSDLEGLARQIVEATQHQLSGE